MYIRNIYLSRIREFYNDKNVKVLVGLRRCGKSYLIKQIIQQLQNNGVDNNHIINISYEDIENDYLLNPINLNKYVKDKIIDKKMYYLFLDEVQLVDNFAHVVNSLRTTIDNLSIFITGSNSKLLPDELSTELSGRYIGFKINPFNYKEFIEYTSKNGYDENAFWEYAKWGGLPNAIDYTDMRRKKEYLNYVFDSIILRDVVERLGLKDTNLFNLILGYLLETVGREFSAENIINYLKNEKRIVSNDTIYNYIDALCKSLLIRKVYRYDIHGKAVLKTLNKYYLTDLGLAYIKKNNPEIDDAYILENIVFNELVVRDYDVYIGKTKKGEIDFYATKYDEKMYIQVAAHLDSSETREREFGAFNNINDNIPKYVLSLDRKNYSRDNIIHKNILDWLLEK